MLFSLEDIYGLTVGEADGEIVLRINVRKNKDSAELHRMLFAWQEQAAKLESGEIIKGNYTTGGITIQSLTLPRNGGK